MAKSNPETPNSTTDSPDNPLSHGEAGDLARGNPESVAEFNGRMAAAGGGDSGGGAYPNPHTGKKPEGGGFMGHGGQTDIAYHGGEQLGEQGLGGNSNSAAGKTEGGKQKD
ncbi:MAG TPA: hypothetical protein VF631_06875 [Allosphingosinicella sp.]|jgi:hypothetical protein|uniref:hypothetical protein n=1 Tax=Allosphingosinicella sp. TaxID=2823234 RepID=UPI002F2A95B6